MRLPFPFLVVRIWPSIFLAAYSSTKIRAIRIIKRVRWVINPFSRSKITMP